MPISRLAGWGLVLLLVGLVGACQSDDPPEYPQAPDRIEPLAVQAASAPLQTPLQFDAAGVNVRVPAGWTQLDSTAAARAHRSVAVDTPAVQLQLLRVVGEQRTSSFLVLSTVRMSSGDVVASIRRHVGQHNPDFLRVDTLRVDGRPPLIDLVIASRSVVHHKVLMPGAVETTAVQFDFVTPRFQYPRMAPLIAASVASVQRAK